MKKKLPRLSPTWNRAFDAHLLSESDSEAGIFHASDLPPTKTSLAEAKPMRTNRTKSEEEAEKVDEKPAMIFAT